LSGFKLREYQNDIINQTINSNVDTLIQVPTGGGKTVISRFIALKLSFFENKRILFVAPKIILMEQALKEFKKLNPQVIHKAQKYNPYHSILVSTIQTASRRDEIYPDVIIVDEIHYGYEGRMLKQLKENHPNARIIGLSATPYDSKGILLKGFDLILDKYDMKYMINNKYLVDLKSYILTKKELISDLEKIKIIRGDYDVAELHDVMCKNSTISEIVETTKEYIEKSKKTIVFAVDINHAELLRQAYNEKGFKASALHSKTKKENNEADEISEEIEKFRRGETRVLVSVLMLTTGFDVPDTDYAIIARPTRSQNLYKQMVGRVLRIADNKTHAVLLDCGNVIKNLGMPLDPVRKIEGNEIVNKHKCSNCKSERLQLIKEEDGLYWKCKDCDERKKVEEGGYACESCCLVSSYEGIFSVEEDKVFLDCECGHKTLISEYRGEEEFVEVESDNYFTIEIISDAILKRTSLSLYGKKIKYYTDVSEKVTLEEAKKLIQNKRLVSKDELLVLSNIKFYDLSSNKEFEYGKWFKRNKQKRNDNLFITKKYLKKFNSNFSTQFWTEDNFFVDFQYGFYYFAQDGNGVNISFISEYHYGINTYRNEMAHTLYVGAKLF